MRLPAKVWSVRGRVGIKPRHGMARSGRVILGQVRHGEELLSSQFGQGLVWRGEARHGRARWGKVWIISSSHSWRDMVWFGEAGLGVVRLG